MKKAKEKISINDEFRLLYILTMRIGQNVINKEMQEDKDFNHLLDLWIQSIFSINRMIPEIVDDMIHRIDNINKNDSFDRKNVDCIYVNSSFDMIMNLPNIINETSNHLSETISDINFGSMILNCSQYTDTNIKLIKSSTYYDAMVKIHGMYVEDNEK